MADALRSVIAAVITGHRMWPDGTDEVQCDCDGQWFKSERLHAEHVADAVIRELEADVMADDYVPPCCRPGGRCNR